MRAVRHFTVVPAIPSALESLREVATNLHWTWDRDTKHLFERLDPAQWAASGHDPLRLLASIEPERWAALAADDSIVQAAREAKARLDAATQEPRWFQGRAESPLHLVAYFSPEFGISETLPQYSGGLGILAGDHLKATSDLGVPLVAIGLLYAEGYFRQRLNADGYQEERFPRLDTSGLALTDTGVQVEVDIAGDPVKVRAWEVEVGRVKLYLLDTAVDGNSPEGFGITNRLYGGDAEHRLRQEIVLGIAGVRVLRALGLQPEVFHTNEGHAGFLSLERIRELVSGEGGQASLSFAEAVEAVRAGGVFTTHTPVPAGIDRFERSVMEKYFGRFAQACGTDFDTLMGLGHRADEPDDTRFNMAVMGLRLGGRSNGVAQLHGEVSREMFGGLWPDIPVEEVPIGAITNGVHAHTWVSDPIDAILRSSVGGVWDGADADTWKGVESVPAADIWAARRIGRAQLVEFVRSRLGDALLDPDALTIGFARRFATYKRATLLLSQPDRLREMLLSADRPVQFVFAGKAHPGRSARQGHDPRDRAVRSPSRRGPPDPVHPRLRHGRRASHVPRLRRVAEQPAPPARGVRHQRHEGRPQRRAELQHPRRVVGRVLRRRERLGDRIRRRRPRHDPAATCARRPACSACSNERSSRCSTTVTRPACRTDGSMR